MKPRVLFISILLLGYFVAAHAIASADQRCDPVTLNYLDDASARADSASESGDFFSMQSFYALAAEYAGTCANETSGRTREHTVYLQANALLLAALAGARYYGQTNLPILLGRSDEYARSAKRLLREIAESPDADSHMRGEAKQASSYIPKLLRIIEADMR